ncbi:MAG: GAF domain-containing protein, partial [Acidobacteriota bacterium]
MPRQGVETIHTPRLEDLNLEPGSRQKLAALVVFDRKAAAPLASAEVLPEVPIIGLHSSPVGPGRLEGDSIFALVQPSRRELVEFFSDLDRLRRLSQSLAEAVCELLGADLGIVWQRDRRLKRFRAAGWHGTLSPELLESLPADLELADEGYEGGLPPPQGLPAPRSGADFDRAFFLPVGSLETGVDGILGGYFSEDSEPSMHQVSKARLCRHLTRQAKAQLAASDSIARSLRRREIRRLAADLSVSQAPMEHLLGLSQRMTAASSGQVFLTTFDDRLQLSVDSGEPPGPRPARESYRDLPSTATLETLSIDEQQAGFDEIIVPLKTSDARIGALQLQSEVGGFFDHHDLAAATEVTSSLLETLTPCPAHRLAASFSELSFARDLEGLAQAIVREVGELTGADTSLWMASTREGERNLAFRTVAHTAGVRPEFAATAKLPITAGSSYTAEALRRREPLWIADVQEAAAQLRFQYVEEARQRGWRSFLVFPLHGGSDEPFAALTLFSSRPSVFGPITVEQLRPLVEQANVALHEERRSEMLHYLVQTERYLNSRMADLPTGLLQDVAGLALRLTTADSVVIYPYDTIRANFYARKYIVGVGLKENWPYRNKPRLRGLAALVRRAGMIIVPDVQALAEDPSKIRIDREGVSHQELAKRILAAPFIRREGIRSFIAISLHSDSPGRPEAPQTEEVGILYINYRTPRTFSKAELETIRIYANQVTSAIRRTWLYLDAKRQADELTTLSDIASRILSRPDRREHLQALVREAADLLRASGATAYIYPADPERQKLSLVAAKGVDSDLCPIGMTVRKGEGLAGRVLESGEPLIVYDYPRWEGRIPRLANTFYSVVGVPLKREQEVVGVLAVFDTIQRRRFDKNRDVPVLERLAHLAALVLEHAQMSRLVDAFRHTTHSSLAISRPVELRELKKTIVDRAASLLIVDRDGGLGAALWRFDTERELAVIEHSTASNFEGTELHLGDGLIKLVIDKGRAAFRNDYPGWRSCPEPFRSSNKLDLLKNVIEVPITYGGKIHYVIAITSSKVDRPFNQDDADLLERFAEFASVALEKAELVLDERHLRQQADILREVSTAMVASHTLHEVGEQILAGLSRVVPYDRATVQRIDGNRRQIVAHKGFKPPRPDERFRPLSADKDIERLVQERSTHIIKNKVADWQGQVEGQRIPTWIGIPLFDGETTLGLITLSCDRPDAYSNGITDTLSLFGSHATVALQK